MHDGSTQNSNETKLLEKYLQGKQNYILITFKTMNILMVCASPKIIYNMNILGIDNRKIEVVVDS